MNIILCFLWLVALATIVQGYKSCGEIQESEQNVSSGDYLIELDGKWLSVFCNFSRKPYVVTFNVSESVMIRNPGAYSSPSSFLYNVDYGGITVDSLRAFIERSESCKQYVLYSCINAHLFGDSQSPMSSWTSANDNTHFYWSGCGFSKESCQCDQGNNATIDEGYLTNKNDLPVKGVQIGGLSSTSNVSITIGNIECYGDSQKGSFTFGNRNAFVSLNVSSMEELKFKFKFLKSDKNKIIASLQIPNEKDITITSDDEFTLGADHQKFIKLDEEWHSIVLEIENKTFYAAVDNGERKAVFNSEASGARAVNLIFGDPQHKCSTFMGCVKDLSVDGEDYTMMVKKTEMKEFVTEGCKKPSSIECNQPKNLDPDADSGNDIPTTVSTVDGKENDTTRDPAKGRDKDNGDAGNDDDAAIIAIVVVFLVLLIILIIVFFITWYLKRNKGVYQTHEGSAEDIHGDTDNLTLVSKPLEQEPEGDTGKEYYL